jgi:hypothetical protein
MTQPITMVGRVFDEFVKRLAADETVDRSIIRRLQATLLDECDLSLEAIRAALLSEEDLP